MYLVVSYGVTISSHCIISHFTVTHHIKSHHILLFQLESFYIVLFYIISHLKLKNTSSHRANKKSVVLVDAFTQEQTEIL